MTDPEADDDLAAWIIDQRTRARVATERDAARRGRDDSTEARLARVRSDLDRLDREKPG